MFSSAPHLGGHNICYRINREAVKVAWNGIRKILQILEGSHAITSIGWIWHDGAHLSCFGVIFPHLIRGECKLWVGALASRSTPL
jgi:hypothetical protein